MRNVKLVFVGDAGTGKTCFLISATTGQFPEEYVPTIFDNYTEDRVLNDGTPCSVYLWDTRGRGPEDYHRLRPLSYSQTDTFVVCFDVSNRSSFENVTEKWIPEIRRFGPEAPVLLLATKTDLSKHL